MLIPDMDEPFTISSTVPCDLTTTFRGSIVPTTLSHSTVIANNLWIYMGAIIFFVGMIGNILILLVMCHKRMRGTSTSDYLIIMAVADILSLLVGMIFEWLSAMEIFDLQSYNPAACKTSKFLNYAMGDVSTWIRVLFTLDRFMAICFPLKKTDCCLAWRAKYYCLGTVIGAVAKNMHVFWTRGAEYQTVIVYDEIDCVRVGMNKTVLKSNCGYPRPAYREFEAFARPWIAFALVNFIPFVVILVCNIFIIRAMIQMKRMREQRRLSNAKGNERVLLQTTAMCLAASFTFLVCITPTMVLLIGKAYWTIESNAAYDIAKSVSNQLIYVNYSVNFFLYCLTGEKFRQTLVQVMTCGRNSKNRLHSTSDSPPPSRRTTRPSLAVSDKTVSSPLATPTFVPAFNVGLSSIKEDPPSIKASWTGDSRSDPGLGMVDVNAKEETTQVEQTGFGMKVEGGGGERRRRGRLGSNASSSGVSSNHSDSVGDYPSKGETNYAFHLDNNEVLLEGVSADDSEISLWVHVDENEVPPGVTVTNNNETPVPLDVDSAPGSEKPSIRVHREGVVTTILEKNEERVNEDTSHEEKDLESLKNGTDVQGRGNTNCEVKDTEIIAKEKERERERVLSPGTKNEARPLRGMIMVYNIDDSAV